MKRIDKIHINNFKFFPDSQPIKIEGKNILLYGENGSGKSSIYWALYTLLECSEKNDITKIRKYFEKSNKEIKFINETGLTPYYRNIILNKLKWLCESGWIRNVICIHSCYPLARRRRNPHI